MKIPRGSLGRLRIECGLPQRDLMISLGVSRSKLSPLENGSPDLNDGQTKALRKIFLLEKLPWETSADGPVPVASYAVRCSVAHHHSSSALLSNDLFRRFRDLWDASLACGKAHLFTVCFERFDSEVRQLLPDRKPVVKTYREILLSEFLREREREAGELEERARVLRLLKPGLTMAERGARQQSAQELEAKACEIRSPKSEEIGDEMLLGLLRQRRFIPLPDGSLKLYREPLDLNAVVPGAAEGEEEILSRRWEELYRSIREAGFPPEDGDEQITGAFFPSVKAAGNPKGFACIVSLGDVDPLERLSYACSLKLPIESSSFVRVTRSPAGYRCPVDVVGGRHRYIQFLKARKDGQLFRSPVYVLIPEIGLTPLAQGESWKDARARLVGSSQSSPSATGPAYRAVKPLSAGSKRPSLRQGKGKSYP